MTRWILPTDQRVGSPAGSHQPNTAVAQAFYNASDGVARTDQRDRCRPVGTASAIACIPRRLTSPVPGETTHRARETDTPSKGARHTGHGRTTRRGGGGSAGEEFGGEFGGGSPVQQPQGAAAARRTGSRQLDLSRAAQRHHHRCGLRRI